MSTKLLGLFYFVLHPFFFFPQMFSVLQLLTKFAYLFVCAGLACCLGFSLVAMNGGCTLAVVCGFLIAVTSLVNRALEHMNFSNCGTWAYLP